MHTCKWGKGKKDPTHAHICTLRYLKRIFSQIPPESCSSYRHIHLFFLLFSYAGPGDSPLSVTSKPSKRCIQHNTRGLGFWVPVGGGETETERGRDGERKRERERERDGERDLTHTCILTGMQKKHTHTGMLMSCTYSPALCIHSSGSTGLSARQTIPSHM